MADHSGLSSQEKYQNPVYERSFPDPFVLKHRGEYYAFCTGHWRDGNVFGVLHSPDLVDWTEIGGAMQPLESDAPFYWAPEVTYDNGKFYLYYSVGNETLMELRVAVSDRPDGGYVDSGVKLTTEEFAIDAHVFTDESGERYMFYATDFLEHSHIGTGTVVDRMIDWFTLEGNPRPVTRAKYDWQVYDPNRIEKGGVRWHTVEGPFILKRKGLYFEMFSGGNWQNTTYGVSFAVSDRVLRDDEWTQFSDGEKVLPILRTIPERIIGPGHNSVVRGPNNRELYCVYHRWTDHGRVLAIDRMDFAGPRLFIHGPTDDAERAPYRPQITLPLDADELNSRCETKGVWKVDGRTVIAEADDFSRLGFHAELESFLCEVSVRALEIVGEDSCFGMELLSRAGTKIDICIFPQQLEASVYSTENDRAVVRSFPLAADFRPEAFHLLKIDASANSMKIWIDEVRIGEILDVSLDAPQLALTARGCKTEFAGLAVTEGFEDLFERGGRAEEFGYSVISGEGNVEVSHGELHFGSIDGSEIAIVKGGPYSNYQFAVNLRLRERSKDPEFGFVLMDEADKMLETFAVRQAGKGWGIRARAAALYAELHAAFDPQNHHQFSFIAANGMVEVQFEGDTLYTLPIESGRTRFGVYCRNCTAAIDMIRLTVI